MATRILLIRHTCQEGRFNSYKAVLERAGYECMRSRDVTDPVQGEYDVVLLCGVSDNLEHAKSVVHAIEVLYPNGPIVVITRHRDPANIEQFMTPRTLVLSRPFKSAKLIQKVEQALSQYKL